MAYISIRWGKNAAHHINYALKERAPDDAAFAHDCSIETADSDFAAVRAEHNQNDGNHVLHVIQSFSPDDSTKCGVEEFNTIGQKLASDNFPGHQFIIKTHTDTDKIHNHIVINTVNSETGKKIENKRALIYRLQDSSDKLCKEYGLSVINREAKERQARLPYKVQQMVRAGKQSYIFDLSQKADVAKSIATNLDEYRDIMHGFGIRVLIEEKNISYFYPGKERGKRGSKLGRAYDKIGLSERFGNNEQKFSQNPELKERFYNQCAKIQKLGMPQVPEGASHFSRLWEGQHIPWHPEGKFKKIPRRESRSHFESEKALNRAFVPADEIKRAREKSIFAYCKENKIQLTKNEKGETVLRGKEFVIVSEFEFTNTKNGTRGSLIDLVAAHKNLTLIQAVAHISGNPRLKLLEQYVGAVPHNYRSFYVPKPEQESAKKMTESLTLAFTSSRQSPSFKATFSEYRIERLAKNGSAWIFLENRPSEKSGAPPGAPITLQHKQAFFTIATVNRDKSPSHFENDMARSIDLFLIKNPNLKKLHFALFSESEKIQPAPDIFTFLKSKYENFGITVEAHHDERSIQRAMDLDTFGRGRSPEKGGLDVGF